MCPTYITRTRIYKRAKNVRRSIHVAYEEEDTCVYITRTRIYKVRAKKLATALTTGGYVAVLAGDRIYKVLHVSYEEEDTCVI